MWVLLYMRHDGDLRVHTPALCSLIRIRRGLGSPEWRAGSPGTALQTGCSLRPDRTPSRMSTLKQDPRVCLSVNLQQVQVPRFRYVRGSQHSSTPGAEDEPTAVFHRHRDSGSTFPLISSVSPDTAVTLRFLSNCPPRHRRPVLPPPGEGGL